MPWVLIFTLIILLSTALVLKTHFKLPKNVWLLFIIQPLAMSVSPVIVFIGGIIGKAIAPEEKWATLPLTLMILGLTLATIPCSFISRKFGRKIAFILGLTLAITGSLLAMLATLYANFSVFLLATFISGLSIAFVMQYRFAALDSVTDEKASAYVVSALMFAGIFAAFIGPEIALMGEHWLASPFGFAGSFLGLAIVMSVALLLMTQIDHLKPVKQEETDTYRPLTQLIKQPLFIIAVLAAAIGYGLMSLLMTATPISMHNIDGYSLNDTKWVIQSHIAAMYLPSLFSGWLVAKLGVEKVLSMGVIAFFGVTIIALQGHHLMHYWWTLVLLGIGWNWLFLSGTLLLAKCYRPEEKHQVQAMNDFIIFGVQALSSLMAGWLVFATSWKTLVYATIPFIVVVLVANIGLYRQPMRNS